MKLPTILILILVFSNCSLLQSPCGNDKDEFLFNFHKFVKDVRSTDLAYNDDAWEDYDLKFKKYTKECYPKYEEEFTRIDKEEYFENTMEYYVTKYGEGLAKQFEEDGEVVFDQIKKEIEDWWDTEGKELESKLEEWADTEGKELAEKLEDTFEKFTESINEEKLEEALQKFSEFLDGIEINIESDDSDSRDL